jgi:CRP/FNR family transcriptional regulator
METIREALGRISLFRELTEEELGRLSLISSIRTQARKTKIFHEGGEREAVFFILDGLVKAFKTAENGHERIVSLLKEGDMFPHTGFFHTGSYPATAEALVDSTLLAIPVKPFERMILDYPGIAIKLMRVMSDKLLELQQQLQELSGQHVQDRSLSFLLKLAENYGKPTGGAIRINIPITHQEFASAVGTTRETVNRVLSQLRKEKLVEVNREGITVLDYEGLKKWSGKTDEKPVDG